MIHSVPKKIIGALICAAALWTSSTQATSLKLEVEHFKDSSIPDPQYKRYLKFMGSWFMTDQVGERPVNKSVGGSEMTVAQHIYTLLPILKKTEALNKDKSLDKNLGNQVKILENAILIHEIVGKVSDPKLDPAIKTATISALNEKIFKLVENGDTVLIPVSWKNNKPGSLLMSLSLESGGAVIRIFDTQYTFAANKKIPDVDEEYPQRIVPWKEIRFSPVYLKRFKFLIPALVILRDDAQLNQYNMVENSDPFLNLLKSYFMPVFSRENIDIGRMYFYSVILPIFGKLRDPGVYNSWPLTSFEMGPVGDILAYFSQAAFNFQNYPAWKLETGYSILKTFLKRFSSDADIHQETRSRIVVSEILKRSANRLLRDAFELTRVQNWIPKQVGEADNAFWKSLHYKQSNQRDLIETYFKKVKAITEYTKSSKKTAEEKKDMFEKHYEEIFGKDSWKSDEAEIETKLKDLETFDAKINALEKDKDDKLEKINDEKKKLMNNSELFKTTTKEERKKKEKEIIKLSETIENDSSLEPLKKEYENSRKAFNEAMKEREKLVNGLIEKAEAKAKEVIYKLDTTPHGSDEENQTKLKLIDAVIKLREEVLAWIKEKSLDTHKLTRLTRSLGQREIPVKQIIDFVIESTVESPVDMTEYSPAGSLAADFSNCMSGTEMTITSFKDFIEAFTPMEKVWHWSRFSFEVPYPHCKSFFRRNSELLLKNMQLGGLDQESLARWAPSNQKEYNRFIELSLIVLDTISNLPSAERTLEDYLIIMRLQRVVWRVAQALDAKFAIVEPQRHLDLIQYSLSFPQCHKLLNNEMTYSNYFLADSGAFGNILDYESVAEMKELCKTLIDDENSGKAVLNFDNYMSKKFPSLIDLEMFNRIDSGDREIYFKMAQNPQIAQTVRENVKKYNFGELSVAGNAARAASLGYVGSQFIFYQFFDAARTILSANIAFEHQFNANLPFKLAYLPALKMGAILPVLPTTESQLAQLSTVNEELNKKHTKSYIKTSITEMITSHILGLDVIVNHIGRGSPKFWSSGKILTTGPDYEWFFGSEFIKSIIKFIGKVLEVLNLTGGSPPNFSDNRFAVKVYRKDVAGSADFFLNCSAHLLRKLDVAPGYEELVMTLLMKTFTSVDNELISALKDLEKLDIVESETDKKGREAEGKEKEGAKGDNKEEMKLNQKYLEKGKTSPDERLKSLINWATIAVRFAARIRSLKPEWKDRYADIPKHFYSTMIKYSRAQKGNNRRLAHLNKNLVAHVDYLLFMICSMNTNDHNLRLEIYQNLKPDSSDQVEFPKDSSVLPAAMVLHRMLALSEYDESQDSPLTEDFITNQFGITQVMKSISLLAEQNEAFLGLMAKYISPFLGLKPKEVLDEYTQGDNLAKGVLIYDRFSINLIQGTFTENGAKARDPNSILRYPIFREFFSSGNEQVTPILGKETYNCPNRFEVENFLQKGSKYSICENLETKRVTIYRHIDGFRKPCMLVRRKRVITALQRAFSVYTNEGVDIYHCERGNNIHFVWINRDSLVPSYVSHGRLSRLYDWLVELVFNDESKKFTDVVDNLNGKYNSIGEFVLDKKANLVDDKVNLLQFLVLPRVTLPKLEIRDIGTTPIFPLTAESKLMVVPEPMIRFSGGDQFGSYILNNKLVFMFQQFRFRDRPEVSLTFVENSDGSLEMKGREDLKVCEDQIFENNFWPALMLRKSKNEDGGEKSQEKRFAYVPISNTEILNDEKSKFFEEISCKYDPESNLSTDSSSTSNLNSSLIFMEEYPVEKYRIGETKTADGKTQELFGYKLKPTSRLQRLLLAFHNLRLRNYDVCLKLLDPRSEIDHNTPFNADEIKILTWMVEIPSGKEPEAYALRMMAKVHLILDEEIFPREFDQDSGASNGNQAEDISDKVIKDDPTLIAIYNNKKLVNFDKLDKLDLDGPQGEIGNNERIGRYFAFLPLLPKRFHIDQVFREAMASQRVQKFLAAQFSTGIHYPEIMPDAPLNVRECIKCKYEGYLDDFTLNMGILEPLSTSDEGKLAKFIEERYTLPYAANNCELPRLLAQKLLHIHAAKIAIPEDLQELAVLYFNLTGNIRTPIENYIFIFSDPSFLGRFTIENLRKMINLNAFKTELQPIVEDGRTIYPERILLIRLWRLAERETPERAVVNQLLAEDGEKTEIKKIITPLLPKAPTAEVDAKERELNSIKFMSEDLHYIRDGDRKIYKETNAKIDKARLAKSAATIPALASLTVESKTQKGLGIAIKDYMDKRIEPIDFDKLEEKLFEKLKENISDRVKYFAGNMKKLEAQYARFYTGTFESIKTTGGSKKEFKATKVLSSLKRIFNNDGIPSLKDLRDCFMQMSRSCLRNRLPEMPESSIVKIAQVLKTYYIQVILSNNLKAINEKIKTFEDLVVKAAAAQNKLNDALKKPSASRGPTEIKDLEDEIFDHKDTALLSVEDIYVDMEKLLQLEQRLKDPVTLNFEFMSAKFHLTKMQVMDIASLASRTWEEKLKKDVIDEYITNILPEDEDKIKGIIEGYSKITPKTKKNDTIIRFAKLVNKFYPDKTVLKTLAGSDKDELLEKMNEIWAHMPREERMVKEEDREKLKNDLYNIRPVLKQLRSVGELQYYDSGKDAYFSRVIQRKMAAGKTTVLGTAATVKKADGKTLSVLVILSALYQSSAPDMQKRTSEFFDTRGFAFSMPKPRLTVPKPGEQNHPARSFLLWTLKTLINTINSNSYLVVTPETLQAFLNSYVEFLDAFINTPGGRLNPELSHCLHLFATIYDIFRSRGSIILDEIDSSMRPQKELNFPTTKREGILLSGVELTSDLLLHSALSKEINEAGLNLLANQQAALNNDQYDEVHKLWRKYVTEQLNDKNSIWHKTFFPDNLDPVVSAADLIKFFFEPSVLDRKDTLMTKEMDAEIDRLAEIKLKSEKIFHAMMIIKMQLKNWLKNCFKGSVNEHYGPSLNQAGQKTLYYAIPYMAANTPAEGSIFADRWETVNKTFMMYLVKNLTLEDLSLILLDLRTLGQNNVQSIDVKAEFTAACPGFDLLNLKFNAQNRLVDKDGKVMQCMKSRSPSALKLIFYWVTKIVFETQQFYAEQITSNAINLTTMFPSVQGYSGTIDNVNILPHQVMIEAEIDHRKNEQANGAIAMKLLNQKNCVTTVQKIEEITQIDKLLDAMCRDFKDDLSAFSAFIDAGALLKDFKNAEVAFALGRKFKREIILFYDERTNQLSFHDRKNGPRHVTALEGSETKYLNSATNSLVKHRFTYYDQRHITGSDILQPPTAKAFLTIGPKVLLRDILQGVMRMRQFQSGQSIHFITTSAVETLLSKFSSTVAPVRSDGKPRVDQSHLIALGALNEDEKQLNENIRLYRVKIDAEIRAFVLDRLTEALAQEDPYTERVQNANPIPGKPAGSKLTFGYYHEQLFEKTRSLFIRNVKENPVNWASLNTVTKAAEAVEKYMKQRIAMIPDDPWKTGKEYAAKWKEVEENLKVLTEDITGSRDLVEKARSVLNYLGETLEISEVSSKFAKPSSDTVDLGSTIEMELQLELQQELELELEQEILDYGSQKPLPEPTLMFSAELDSNSKVIPGLVKGKAVPARGTPFDFLHSIKDLFTPWSLHSKYASKSGPFSKALKNIFDADIFCPGMAADEKDVTAYCQSLPGFVGLSNGLAKVSTSPELDFVTMASREGTHLLFWRGRKDYSAPYKYAVFLLSGSEALSLHRYWAYKSCSIGPLDSFWLTDLYGFELHGSPFASTAISSNHFSLLESEYKEHFIDLHFRALLLNASYNVIMTSKAMQDRMRAWVGDFDMMKKLDPKCTVGLKRESAEKRVGFFINRLTWMSKLRDEIVPDDPFIRDIMKVYANQPVDFEETANRYTEQLDRGQTETYSDKMAGSLIDPEDPEAKPWKASKNINESEHVAIFNWLIVAFVIVLLLVIAFVWGRSAGIDWSEFFKTKWASLTSFMKKSAENAAESMDATDQIVPTEPAVQEEVATENN